MPVERSPFTGDVSPQTLPPSISLRERHGWSVRYEERGSVDPISISAKWCQGVIHSEKGNRTFKLDSMNDGRQRFEQTRDHELGR
jgi:hypothetical protein